MRARPVSGFQNPLSSSACGEAAIRSSLAARMRAVRVEGELREAAVGVEHRRQREDVRDARPEPRDRAFHRAEAIERGGVERLAGRHDQLHEPDPAESRLDGVVVADNAGVALEQVDVVRLVAEVEHPQGQREHDREDAHDDRDRVPEDPAGQPVHVGGDPGAGAVTDGDLQAEGGSIATGEIAITRRAETRVQMPRIAPNWTIGTTSLVTSAP